MPLWGSDYALESELNEAIYPTIQALPATTGTCALQSETVYKGALTGDTTFTVNGMTSGRDCWIRMYVDNLADHTVTFPTGFKWENDSAPTFTTALVYAVQFVSYDGGTSGMMASNGSYDVTV